jgi:hypothetical protein
MGRREVAFRLPPSCYGDIMVDKVESLLAFKNRKRAEAEGEEVTIGLSLTRYEWAELYYSLFSKAHWIRENAEEIISDHGDPEFPEYWASQIESAAVKVGTALSENEVPH